MERQPLASPAANYPFLLGLHGIPVGLFFFLTVPVNLWRGPSEAVMLGVFGVGWVLCIAAVVRVARHYRETYGWVTPIASRYVRQVVALLAWAAALFGATALVATPDAGVVAAAFAVGLLAYTLIMFGPRPHELAVWGALLVIGLLPVWEGVAVDWGSIPIGVAFMMSGILDHRLVARGFGIRESLSSSSPPAGG